MSDRFQPLSRRRNPAAGRSGEVLHEGVPDHLLETVDVFVRMSLIGRPDFDRQLRQLERELEIRLDGTHDGARYANLLERGHDDREFYLDVVDHRLGHAYSQAADQLNGDLFEAGSAWKVVVVGAPPNDRFCLERRVEEVVEAAAKKAIEHGRAGVHLLNAWREIYGRTPNPSEAYREAVRAVEVAAGPVVQPKHVGATLGTMVGEMKANPQLFLCQLGGQVDVGAGSPSQLDGAGVARAMAQLLWRSQHDRHGNFTDESAAIHVSQSEAEAAVHLAATLVQWFATGVIQRKR